MREFLERLEHVRRSGAGYAARCPAHEDTHASLSVSEGDGGKLLAKCHAGCSFENILAAAEMPRRKGTPTMTSADLRLLRNTPGIVATYDYVDEDGNVLYEVVRYDNPKDFKQRRTDPFSASGYTWKLGDIRRVLYHLPEVIEAAALDKTIYVTEGEKDADALIAIGLPATTNSGGAGKWRPEYSKTLRDANVVILPDNDDAGRSHAEKVAASLLEHAANVRIVALPGLPVKGDVSDWLRAGGTVDALQQLVSQAAQWTGSPIGEVSDASSEAPAIHVWRTLADIDSTAPADLFLGIFEPDGPNMIYSAGGVGKGSTLAYMTGESLKHGKKPMIYDPENRPKEWSRRCHGLGINGSDVIYLQPNDLPRSLLGLPLWEIVPHIGCVAKRAGADILFVDSILAGMNVGEERLKSDAQAPYLYVSALDAIGIPSVSTGHTSRATPEGEPYGSVSWVNAMRLTWLGTPAEGDGHRVRWRPRKRNERGAIPSVLLHFIYDDGKTLSRVERSDDELDTRAWITAALARGERTVEELAEELADSYDEVTVAVIDRTKSRLRQALARMKRDTLVTKATGKRNSPWRLVRESSASRKDYE